MSSPKTQSAVEKDFEAYISGTEPVSDTMRRAARAFLMLAIALSKVVGSQTAKVDSVADEMTQMHTYMSLLNDKVNVAGPEGTENNHTLRIFEDRDKTKVEEFRKALLYAAGEMGKGDSTLYPISDKPDASGKWYWELKVDACNTANKNLQMAVDDLSSLSQQEQLALQTLMSRFNASMEAATSATQKATSQAQMAVRGLTA
jgi:hypothetical protein